MILLGIPALACNLSSGTTEPTPIVSAAPTVLATTSPTPDNSSAATPAILPRTPQPNECGAAPKPGATVNVYTQPSLLSDLAGTLPAGQTIVIAGRSADGWLGFDPGAAQEGNPSMERFRWIPPNSSLTLTGNCQNLQILSIVSHGSTPGSNPPPGASPTLIVINSPGDVPMDVCSVTPVNPPVNIRSGPSTSATIIGKLYTPAPFAAIQGSWYTITLPNGGTGWVAASVSALIGACSGVGDGTR